MHPGYLIGGGILGALALRSIMRAMGDQGTGAVIPPEMQPGDYVLIPRGLAPHIHKFNPRTWSTPMTGKTCVEATANWLSKDKLMGGLRAGLRLRQEFEAEGGELLGMGGTRDLKWDRAYTNEGFTAPWNVVLEYMRERGLADSRIVELYQTMASTGTLLAPAKSETVGEAAWHPFEMVIKSPLVVDSAAAGLIVWPHVVYRSPAHRLAWLRHAQMWLTAARRGSEDKDPLKQIHKWSNVDPASPSGHQQALDVLLPKEGKAAGAPMIHGEQTAYWNFQQFWKPTTEQKSVYYLTVFTLARLGFPGLSQEPTPPFNRLPGDDYGGFTLKGALKAVAPLVTTAAMTAAKGPAGAALGVASSIAQNVALAGQTAKAAALPWHESWEPVAVPVEALGYVQPWKFLRDSVAATDPGTVAIDTGKVAPVQILKEAKYPVTMNQIRVMQEEYAKAKREQDWETINRYEGGGGTWKE